MITHFDPEQHKYYINGAEVPSVTQILKEAGIIQLGHIPQDALEAAGKFGTAVHKATELWDKGTLDAASLDPALVPYLSAWKKFLVDTRAQVLLVEHRVFSHSLGYAGTLDRVLVFNGKKWVVDIKSSASWAASTALQTYGYMAALKEMTADKTKFGRMCVALKADGAYDARAYEDDSIDRAVFNSALTITQWKRRNKYDA